MRERKDKINRSRRIDILKNTFIQILMAKNLTNKQKDKLTTEYIKKLQQLKSEIGGGH